MCSILEELTQSLRRRAQVGKYDMSQGDCDNEICVITQFLQIQKKQVIELQEHMEQYCKVLTVFAFNSVKYDLNFIKSFLLPILVNERKFKFLPSRKPTSYLVQNWWNSAIGYIDFSWWSNKSWFSLEGNQDFRNRRFHPLRMVRSTRQNADQRTSPVWRFLQ